MEKIYLVCLESNVDGDIIFHVTPCGTFEKAKEILKTERDFTLNESVHYSEYTLEELKNNEEFEFIDEECHFLVLDYNDDYWEDYYIEERQIQY
jgi:hypothetical protein